MTGPKTGGRSLTPVDRRRALHFDLSLSDRMLQRINYYRRIFSAYLGAGNSQLTFWHDVPEVNSNLRTDELAEYYMPFTAKANYQGPCDSSGIPMLNYRGVTGLQYNPIAIAQYGIGNYNLYRRTTEPSRRSKFLNAADWLLSNLTKNSDGLYVWNHHFDWEYRTVLKAPWYSGLAQGQGISLLVRAHADTHDSRYLEAAGKAFETFQVTADKGGVACVDEAGDLWFEEYIVWPPSHILNGFIWATWGVFDYYLATGSESAKVLFAKAANTLVKNIERYDVGYWSLYEQTQNGMINMLASHFYHSLHIAQLTVQHRLTGDKRFEILAQRWDSYRRNPINRARAFTNKVAFKLLYY